MRIRLKIATVFLLVLLFAVGVSGAGVGSQSGVLNQRVPLFEIKDASLIDGLSRLSLSSIAGLHLGIEEASGEEKERSLSRFSLRLENKSVSQILDVLCQYDNRYQWSADGKSINVYPRNAVGDSSYLLNRRLGRIDLIGVPDPDQALTPIAKEVPSGNFGYIQMGGDITYEAPWTITFENLTVRQFINRVAEHLGGRSSWIFQRSRDFTFQRGGFHIGKQDDGS